MGAGAGAVSRGTPTSNGPGGTCTWRPARHPETQPARLRSWCLVIWISRGDPLLTDTTDGHPWDRQACHCGRKRLDWGQVVSATWAKALWRKTAGHLSIFLLPTLTCKSWPWLRFHLLLGVVIFLWTRSLVSCFTIWMHFHSSSRVRVKHVMLETPPAFLPPHPCKILFYPNCLPGFLCSSGQAFSPLSPPRSWFDGYSTGSSRKEPGLIH